MATTGKFNGTLLNVYLNNVRYLIWTICKRWPCRRNLQRRRRLGRPYRWIARLVRFYWRIGCIWRHKQRRRHLHAIERSNCCCFEIYYQRGWRLGILRKCICCLNQRFRWNGGRSYLLSRIYWQRTFTKGHRSTSIYLISIILGPWIIQAEQ